MIIDKIPKSEIDEVIRRVIVYIGNVAYYGFKSDKQEEVIGYASKLYDCIGDLALALYIASKKEIRKHITELLKIFMTNEEQIKKYNEIIKKIDELSPDTDDREKEYDIIKEILEEAYRNDKDMLSKAYRKLEAFKKLSEEKKMKMIENVILKIGEKMRKNKIIAMLAFIKWAKTIDGIIILSYMFRSYHKKNAVTTLANIIAFIYKHEDKLLNI